MEKKIRAWVQYLERFVDRPWYGPVIGCLALLDNLIVIIPNDGILISSTMLVPRRWATFALCISTGSTLGAMLLAVLVKVYGSPWLLEYYPGLDQSASWIKTQEFFAHYGLLVVFGVAITPFIQQPAVVLAALSPTPIWLIGLVVFAGRVIKFLIMAYVASHAPRLLAKMWGVSDELKDVGIDPHSISVKKIHPG